MRLALITLVSVVAVCAAVSFTPTAGAATKQLWHIADLDPIASEVAGFPLEVDTSDNIVEWSAIAGYSPYEILGFTYPAAGPGSRIYNTYDGYWYSLYHTIWVSPSVFATFRNIGSTGINTTTDPNGVAIALMVLDHESQHQKLHSFDEGRVNACALSDLPRLLSTKFNVPETTQGTVLAATTTRVRTRYRVRVRVNLSGHWVYRYRYRFKYVTKNELCADGADRSQPGLLGCARRGSKLLRPAAGAVQHRHLLVRDATTRRHATNRHARGCTGSGSF